MKTTIFALALTAITPAAAMDLQGTVFDADTLAHYYIGPGVTHTRLALSAKGRSATVNVITLDKSDPSYSPIAEPRVEIGNDRCTNAESVSSMAKRKSSADRQYIAGINGDFFITSSFAANHEFGNAILGYPNMSCVIDGKIAAPDMIDIVSRENALIIGSDNMWIDATDLTYKVLNSDGSKQVKATAVNYPRRNAEMVVYNSYMGATTGTSGGRELLLRMAEGAEWKINSTTKFVVDGTWRQGGNSPIPADGIVISCGPDYANDFIDALADGDAVKLKIILSLPAFDKIKPDIKHVIGGDVRILNSGKVTTEAIRWINTPSSPYQRTLTGYSQDRSKLVLATVDGNGLTYFESADLMAALGCYDALDLDGGGSTAMWSAHAGLLNKPRDGAERAVGNALFVTLNAPADNEPASIRFADPAITMPLYGSLKPTIMGYNRYGQLIDTDMEGVALSAPEAMADINSDEFTAISEGTFALTATVGNMTATVAVRVDGSTPVEAPATILIDGTRTVVPELTSTVAGKKMPVATKAFDWTSSDESVVEVDANGAIKGISTGTATVCGKRGEIEMNIAVNVQIASQSAMPVDDDFCGDSWRITKTGVSDITFTDADGAKNVQFKITNKRTASVTLAKAVAVYSLPDGMQIRFDPKGCSIRALSAKVTASNSKTSKILEVADPSLADTHTLPLDEKFDLSDISIFPLTFSSLTFEPRSGADGGSLCNITLGVPEFVYNNYSAGVGTVDASSSSRPSVIREGNTLTVLGAKTIELYSPAGILVGRSSGSTLTLPGKGIYILRADRHTFKIVF